jgi:excisionase family DNA binding protein
MIDSVKLDDSGWVKSGLVSRRLRVRNHFIGNTLARPADEDYAMAKSRKILTIVEVSDFLRLHPTTVYRLVRRGELPAFQIGGGRRVNMHGLDRWCIARSEADTFARAVLGP